MPRASCRPLRVLHVPTTPLPGHNLSHQSEERMAGEGEGGKRDTGAQYIFTNSRSTAVRPTSIPIRFLPVVYARVCHLLRLVDVVLEVDHDWLVVSVPSLSDKLQSGSTSPMRGTPADQFLGLRGDRDMVIFLIVARAGRRTAATDSPRERLPG